MSFFNDFAFCYDSFASYDYDRWAAYIQEIFARHGLSGSLHVLDAACGTGGVSIRLSRDGHAVTGLDQSADMLRIAADKARRFGADVRYVQGDVTDIRLHKPADAIVMTCDGLNYLTSGEAVMKFFMSARRNLKENGLLAFDISSRYKIESILANRFFAEENDEAAYLWQNSYDGSARVLHMDITVFNREGNGLYRRGHELHTQKAYDAPEIIALAEQCGFTASVHHCFTFDPPRETSERLQFVCVAKCCL